jgi:hypothetical protein
MSKWAADELDKIGAADELEIAAQRPGGSLRPMASAAARAATLRLAAANSGSSRMARSGRTRVTSAAEASGCLVAPPVFKTGGRRFASSAGSIPVRLRHPARELHEKGHDKSPSPTGSGHPSCWP